MDAVIAPAAGQSAPITDYLDVVEPVFVAYVSDASYAAIKRQLFGHYSGQFFSDIDQLRLTNRLASALAVSDLVGRATIQIQADREIAAHPGDFAYPSTTYESFDETVGGEIVPWTADQLRELFTPAEALAFFRKIANLTGPGVENASLFETLMTGRAFSIAATADTVIRERVAKVIEQRIETGKDIRGAGRVIDEILDASGVAHANGYGAMVSRTNIMEGYRGGAWSRYKDPDLDALMPVWRYIGIRDGRQRQGPEPEKPDHRIHTGKYWPRNVDFTSVRGTTIRDVANCRCGFAAISKRQWAKLSAGGAKLESVPIPSWPTV